MFHAYKLFTGAHGQSHAPEGTVDAQAETQVGSIEFSETAAHSRLDWHDAPVVQYVITLAGTLVFRTRDGESFTLRPGDVLVAADTAGGGHEWRLEGDDPWRRVYVVLKPGAPDRFVAHP